MTRVHLVILLIALGAWGAFGAKQVLMDDEWEAVAMNRRDKDMIGI